MTHSTSQSNPMLSGVRELIGAEILVIDQDTKIQAGMTTLLSAASLHVTSVGDLESALKLIARQFFSVVIVDLDTPSPGAGLETIREVKAASPTSMIIVLTPRKAFNELVLAIRAGAVDVILKSPESVAYLKERVLAAAGRSVDKREVSTVLSEVRAAQDEFLKLFMDAERRALDLSDQLAGRDPTKAAMLDELAVLVVDAADAVAQPLRDSAPAGFRFEHAQSGGAALDRCGQTRFHYVMVAETLPDLPSSMVIRSIKTQHPEIVVMSFAGPRADGFVDIVDSVKTTRVIDGFSDPRVLLGRLDELAEAFRAKSRERRYTQAFRERHYDFLRRYVELKLKIDRASTEGR